MVMDTMIQMIITIIMKLASLKAMNPDTMTDIIQVTLITKMV